MTLNFRWPSTWLWMLKMLYYVDGKLSYVSLSLHWFIFSYVNHVWFYSWNQSVLLSNESEVSCSRKQWETLMGLKLITDWLQSDVLPTASSRTLFLTYFGWFSFHNICVTMTLGWSRLPVFRSKLFYAWVFCSVDNTGEHTTSPSNCLVLLSDSYRP